MIDEIGCLVFRNPWLHVLDDAHGDEGAHGIGGSENQFGASACQGGCLKTAAEFFGFFIERVDANVGMSRFKASHFFVQNHSFGDRHLMPKRNRLPFARGGTTSQQAEEHHREAANTLGR